MCVYLSFFALGRFQFGCYLQNLEVKISKALFSGQLDELLSKLLITLDNFFFMQKQ